MSEEYTTDDESSYTVPDDDPSIYVVSGVMDGNIVKKNSTVEEEDNTQELEEQEEIEVTKSSGIPKYIDKVPISKEDKKFITWVKRYFSNLSARRCRYAYFNMSENKNIVIFSNTGGGLFMDFNPGELSLHVVEFKDPLSIEYLNRLKTILIINDITPEIRTVNTWLTWVNKCGLEPVMLYECKENHVFVVTHTSIADIPYVQKQVMGTTLTNFIVINHIHKWLHYIDSISHLDKFYIDQVINTNPKMENIMLFEDLDLSHYKEYKSYLPLTIISFDGLSNPALKEFVNKTKTTFTYIRRIWAENTEYFKFMTIFENEETVIRTIRPYMGVFLIKHQHISE